MKKSRSGRIVISKDGNVNNRGAKATVRPLKNGYSYGSPLDEERIQRSLDRINRRKQK